MSYTYEYPRPSVTVDAVVFGYDEGELRVLLIERGEELSRDVLHASGFWEVLWELRVRTGEGTHVQVKGHSGHPGRTGIDAQNEATIQRPTRRLG